MIKNLLIGYIKVTQQAEKKQVLKLIATMLSFNSAELELVENSSSEAKWFSLLKPSTPSKSPQGKTDIAPSSSSLDKSFTELLIQYVDRESKPKPSLSFDLSSRSSSNAAAKKTDEPSASLTPPPSVSNSSVLNTSNNVLLTSSGSVSAIKFFNSSLVNPASASNAAECSSGANQLKDHTLVNRGNGLGISNQQTSQASRGSAAEQFLDQILKQS